jgi:8-oxo-dGTP pyrophosphatase MutT (NUDIX family)
LKVSYSGIREVIRREDVDKPQAGAIVVRGNGEQRRFLLVTNKGGDRWLFPKGTVKKKESSEEAAEREAEEEAGIRARVVAYVGGIELQEDDVLIRIDYFLLAAQDETDMEENRKRRWVTAEELLELIEIPEICALLRRALPDLVDYAISKS